MRIVAVAMAVLSLVALYPPTVSADDCANVAAPSFCTPINATRPNSPPGVPSLPPTTYWGKYYLWLGVGYCVGATLPSADCRGVPATGPVGVEKPDQVGGGTVGFGQFGMLYEETNGFPGLQRFVTSSPGDRMVLI